MANEACFQVYRLVGADGTWWRVVSPNGRVLARSPQAFDSPSAAVAHIAQVRAARLSLQASVRVTPLHRWRWQLALDSTVMVVSWADLDRRIRCEAAWRSFVALAGLVPVDPRVHTFQRGQVSDAV
ncbi:MAG: hypothetical protein FWH11_08335 [Micrococcales bacterium]|nr:hypothetical protein [Micrococcales bacterium]